LTALAADLLFIARAEEKALPVHLETLPVAELLGAVAARFAARAGELGRDLRVEPDGGLVLDADPRRLEQALGNLVDNALLHGAGAVTLTARAVGGRVELHVGDEGAGFPPEFAARAFDRFSRADEARRRSGSGLGLAIVRAIALAHHGTVGVGASASGGADVWLSFPGAPLPTPEPGPAGRVARGRSRRETSSLPAARPRR
jgi:signal transduction histidine kinase